MTALPSTRPRGPKTRIYVEPDKFGTDRAILAESASHHLRDVLRFRPGDELVVFNGIGREAVGVLELYQGDQAIIRVLREAETSSESALELILAPSLAKGKKIDLVVEKAVELGVDRICPVTSQRSVARLSEDAAIDRVERWRRIALSATEQCGRTQIATVERIRPFSEFVVEKPEATLGLIFSSQASPDPPATLRQRFPDTRSVICIIGPEGGFTDDEVKLAREHGFIEVGLGPRTLRAETAAIVAAAVCQHLWGDLGRKPPTGAETE